MKKIARRASTGPSSSTNLRAQKLISSGVVEGLNNKAKVTMRKSYGFSHLPRSRTRLVSLTWQARVHRASWGAWRSVSAQCVRRAAPCWPRPHDSSTPDLVGVSGQAGGHLWRTAVIGRPHSRGPDLQGRSPARKKGGDDRVTRPGATWFIVRTPGDNRAE